jgi:hypothetical protein
MSASLDTPWDPDSLTIAPRTVAEAHLALSAAAWLGDDWCCNTATGEVAGPGRQRLRFGLDDRTGTWMVHIVGQTLWGMDGGGSHFITVPAELPPSAMAHAIRSRLLPDYELALAVAFEGPEAVKAARRRQTAARANLVASRLGDGWLHYQDDAGIASASNYCSESDGPNPACGSFAFNESVCDLLLTVDWELAEQIAETIASYISGKEADADERR